MSIERSHGKLRPRRRRTRAGSSAEPMIAVVTAPLRDGTSGRFAPGNDFARARALKEHASSLVGLNPAECVAWLRPFAELAGGDAVRLAEEHGALGSAVLEGLCENTATAHAVYRGLLAFASKTGDLELLGEARQWLREHRQNVIVLRAEARGEQRARANQPLTQTEWDAMARAAKAKSP